MRAKMVIFSGWVYVALAAAAVPIALIIIFLAAGNSSVAWELTILSAIFAAVMILGLYTSLTAKAETYASIAVETEAAEAGIEWIDEVPVAPLVPVIMRVVKVTGACAFGFMPGNEWVIDTHGHLSRPLCAAAFKAFSDLPGSQLEDGLPRDVACKCPLAAREVVFAIDVEDELAETTG